MQPDTVVHCTTDVQAFELLNWASSKGLKWSDGTAYSSYKNCYPHYRSKTCYDILSGYYTDIDNCKRNNYNILKFEEARMK